MDNLLNVLTELIKIFTFQNISFALGFIGTVGTAINVINSRKNLKLKLRFFNSDSDKKLALAYIQFENKSNSSILITDVNLIIDDVPYPCQKLPEVVQTTLRKIGTETFYHEIYNIPFPIQLSGLGGTSGYLLFEIPQYMEEKQYPYIMFQVATNRGRSKKYLLCPDRECF